MELGALPTNVRVLYSNADVRDGMLRAAYARLQDNGDGIALLQAPLSGAGLGAWQDTKWSSGFRGHPRYAFSNTFTYAIGGYSSAGDSNTVLQSAEATGLADATSSFDVTALPKPTAFGQAVTVDDYVFVLGGKNGVLGGAGQPDTFSAKASPHGTLSAWTTTAPLPRCRTSLAVTVAGDFLYATGSSTRRVAASTQRASRRSLPRGCAFLSRASRGAR